MNDKFDSIVIRDSGDLGPLTLKTATVDGKSVAYSNYTEFLVQVGRGPKGAYRTRYTFIGNLTRALMHYDMINIGNGYKKRLLMPNCSQRPVIAKAKSEY